VKQVPSQRQIIERMINEGVHYAELGRWQQVGNVADALADRGDAGPVLVALLTTEVAAAWAKGWQPAELVRSARREFHQYHAELLRDVIRVQMRFYAAATVDERWWAQLVELQADDEDLPESDLLADNAVAGEPAGMPAERAISLIWHLRRLPRLPFQGPPPGEARQGSLRATGAEVDQRMLDRVRALLAKAESTTFPEEAEAYTAKAQELMARHRIDHALLIARTGGRDEPGVRRVAIDNPYEAPKTLLLQAVAEANGCQAVWTRHFGFATVTGFPNDLDSVELLFTSLLVQGVRAMTQTGPKQDRYGRNNTRSFRQAFLTSFAQRIGERLADAADTAADAALSEVGQETRDELLPVLRARAIEVQEKFRALFPSVQTQTVSVSNREGWVEGRVAADRADLHGRRGVRA
jgi:hypothetical protein